MQELIKVEKKTEQPISEDPTNNTGENGNKHPEDDDDYEDGNYDDEADSRRPMERSVTETTGAISSSPLFSLLWRSVFFSAAKPAMMTS